MMLEHSKHAEFYPSPIGAGSFPVAVSAMGKANNLLQSTEKKWAAMKSVEKALQRLVKAHIDIYFPPDPWMGKKRDDETLEDLLERNGMKCSWCDYREHCSFWSLTDEFLDEIMEEEQ